MEVLISVTVSFIFFVAGVVNDIDPSFMLIYIALSIIGIGVFAGVNRVNKMIRAMDLQGQLDEIEEDFKEYKNKVETRNVEYAKTRDELFRTWMNAYLAKCENDKNDD